MNTPAAWVTLIDGRSGSGKTTLAEQLAAADGAQVLHLEDLYPGWGGLAAGSRAVATALERGRYVPYDWVAEEFRETGVVLDPGVPLIIEGCGAITRANLEASERWAGTSAPIRSLWLELDEPLRRSRALARDGEVFSPHWDRWAAQEIAHFSRHEPWLLATEVKSMGVSRSPLHDAHLQINLRGNPGPTVTDNTMCT